MENLVDFLTTRPDVALLELSEAITAIRLYLAGESEIHDGLTLTEFYKKCYFPEVSAPKRLKKDTITQRECALRYWVEATGDPALCNIDKKTLLTFVNFLHLRVEAGLMSPATVNKHCSALSGVLDYAGPKTPKDRDARELIPMPPAFPSSRVLLNPTSKTPSRMEVNALLKATRVARYPILPRITPAKWWECAYKVLALTGMRKGDLLGLQWKHIQVFEWGTGFVIPAEVEKTGQEKIIPISSALRAVIDEMPRGKKDDYIFQWPHSDSLFHSERQKIIDGAGVARCRGTWHAIRRFVATHVADAQLVLGHTTSETTRRHYQSMARAAQALEDLGNLILREV